jgi:hypothetical protein
MRGTIFFIILFYAFSLNAQNLPTEGNGFIPKITLPSPEAFSFTKYGDIPVGLFTGTMTYSVPLFNIKSGKISVPVSLDYSSNGIKVDAVSGRTGMDWILKAGGIITRNIMGKPDDWNALYTPSSNDSSSWTFYNYINYVGSNDINTQPDEYSYNFLGQSGKFYFDYAGNIRELSPSGMKISLNSSNFQITGQDGTKYFFTPYESSFNYSLFGDNNAINTSYGGLTAWYLTKIKNVYGDSIVYKYELINSPGTLSYLSGINQTYKGAGNVGANGSMFVAHYFKSSNCSSFGDIENWEVYANPDAIGTNTDVRITAIDVAKLTEIIFKGGKLKFYYSGRDDLPGEQKLDSIDLINSITNSRISTVGLEYLYSESSSFNTPGSVTPAIGVLQSTYTYLTKRLFLEKIKIYNQFKTEFLLHKFDYDAINDLPPRLSFAQDYYGYFNGKSNSYFLPDNTMFNNRISLNSVTSNRSIDTNYSKKGVLTKITYPTGGYSKINYQSNYLANYIGNTEVFDTVTVLLNYNGNSFSATSETFKLSEIPYVVKLSAEWITPPDYNGPLDDSNVIFKIIDVNTNSSVLGTPNYNVWPGYPVQIIDRLFILNKVDDYQLYLEGGNANVRAKAEFIFFRYVRDTLENHATAGLRVGSIINYTSNNDKSGFKGYDYRKPDGKSSGSSVIKFIDGRDFSYVERSISSAEIIGGNYVLSSSGVFGDYRNDFGSINYEYVTEAYDSLVTNGKIFTQFSLARNSLPTTFRCFIGSHVEDHSPFLIPNAATTNTGYMAGKEIKKAWFKNTSGEFKKTKEVNNYYSTDSRLYHVDSFYIVKKAITRGSYNISWKYFSDFDINKYKRITAWVHLDSTIQKDYDDLDQELLVKTTYSYGNSSHLLPTEVFQQTSKGDVAKKQTRYTDDLRQQDVNNSVLNGMLASNLISVPLVNKSLLNSSLLTSDSTIFNSNLLPFTFRKSIGNNSYELEAEITGYDSWGNPTEFKVRDQVKSILNDTVLNIMIAACENAAYNDIAYTSFETIYNGNWSGINNSYYQSSGGLTGERYYNQSNFNLYKTGLNSSTSYYVTYWSKNGSYSISGTLSGYPKNLKAVTVAGITWSLYEHLVSGQTTISVTGSGSIDELRLYPKNALMTSYTHKPLIGISSVTDVNNNILIYNYDAFNRLFLIRDEHNNIRKKYCYNYAGQQENCTSSTTAVWQNTGQTRCKPCPSNSNFISNVLQNQQSDINTESSTYGQLQWVDAGTSSSCVPPASWQNTATAIRCKTVNGTYTGEQEQEQIDQNPCSSTHNTTRWVVVGTNCTTCPKPQNWQTTGNYRCVKDGNNYNTGEQEKEEKDMETCSSTYNQTRWVSNGNNATACPSCTYSNCEAQGAQYKCINGVCETGIKVYTASDYNYSTGRWDCTYHYEWSDNSWSQNYVEDSWGECPIW